MIRGKESVLLLLLLVSCAKDDSAKKTKLTPPNDEATQDQRAQLDGTLSQIEALTRELGRSRTFRSVPIVVTTDNAYTDHPAACVSSDGQPQFILIKPSVFDSEAELSAGGVESSLFRVVLHEIGHCYFGRQHEEARLFEEGKSIEVVTGAQTVDYPMLDASVMVPEELTAPIALEKYYVAELLGLARANKPADLAAYASVKLVRDTWTNRATRN